MATALPKYGTSDSGNSNLIETQAGAETTANTLFKLISSFAQHAVVVSEIGTPPVSPAEGDVHLLSGIGGAWSAFDIEDLALYMDGAWYEIDPYEGLTIWQQDTNQTRVYNGSDWVEKPSGVSDGLTANAGGGGVGSALALTRRINNVTTVATTADSVALPQAKGGREYVIINNGANSMNIYPDTGEEINAGGNDGPFALAAGDIGRFYCVNADNWYAQTSTMA
jgi:hypothetical protein